MRILALATRTLPLLVLAGCAYEAPLHPDAFDGGAPDNVIAGEIVFSGDVEPAYVVVYVTDAADPMPPSGTGRPLTFSTVPASAFTGEGAGIQSAPYAVTGVPDGEWIITALMDVDHDFHPAALAAVYEGASGALAGATCGDWVGGHLAELDPVSPVLTPVSVSGGEYKDDVTVLIASEVPVERPAFTLPGGAEVSLQTAVSEPTTLQLFTLEATAVHTAFADFDGTTVTYDLDGPFAGGTCETTFLTHVVDADLDGYPDPHPDVPTVFDIWPRIGLVYAGQPVDADQDGLAEAFASDLAGGEAYMGLAVVSPTMLPPYGTLPIGAQTYANALDVLWLPGGIHVYRDATGAEVVETVDNPLDLPTGAWSITVIEETGQTWSLPNPLWAAPSTQPTLYDPLTQAAYLTVGE